MSINLRTMAGNLGEARISLYLFPLEVFVVSLLSSRIKRGELELSSRTINHTEILGRLEKASIRVWSAWFTGLGAGTRDEGLTGFTVQDPQFSGNVEQA